MRTHPSFLHPAFHPSFICFTYLLRIVGKLGPTQLTVGIVPLPKICKRIFNSRTAVGTLQTHKGVRFANGLILQAIATRNTHKHRHGLSHGTNDAVHGNASDHAVPRDRHAGFHHLLSSISIYIPEVHTTVDLLRRIGCY